MESIIAPSTSRHSLRYPSSIVSRSASLITRSKKVYLCQRLLSDAGLPFQNVALRRDKKLELFANTHKPCPGYRQGDKLEGSFSSQTSSFHSQKKFFSARSEQNNNETSSEASAKKKKKAKKTGKHDMESSDKQQVLSLRKAISPFLLLCHPDKIPPHLVEAKQVNLSAVQTINSFIDMIQTIFDGLTDKSATSGATATVLSSVSYAEKEYDIEFMVPTGPEADKRRSFGSIETESSKDKLVYTRRSVVLSIPSAVIQNVRQTFQIVGTTEQRIKLSSHLMGCALHEIAKVLKAAELKVPAHLVNARGIVWNGDGSHRTEQMLRGEILDDWRSDFEIDWEYEKKRYEAAVRRMEEDIATLGMTDPRRKQQIVAGIVGRVRFLGDVSGVDQLITLRRLLLLLEDQFDVLQMEDYGKLWENMVIILADDGTGVLAGSTQSATAKLRRRRQKGESGFKFSLRGDYHLVVTIPLSFLEWQFIDEFKRHLHHFDMEDDIY